MSGETPTAKYNSQIFAGHFVEVAVGLDNKQELDKILKHVRIDGWNLLQKTANHVNQSLVILASCMLALDAYREAR